MIFIWDELSGKTMLKLNTRLQKMILKPGNLEAKIILKRTPGGPKMILKPRSSRIEIIPDLRGSAHNPDQK